MIKQSEIAIFFVQDLFILILIMYTHCHHQEKKLIRICDKYYYRNVNANDLCPVKFLKYAAVY